MFVRKCNMSLVFCRGEKKSHNWRDIKGSVFKLQTHENKTKTFLSLFFSWPWVVSSHAESISFICLGIEFVFIAIPVDLPVLPMSNLYFFLTSPPPSSQIFPYLFKKQKKNLKSPARLMCLLRHISLWCNKKKKQGGPANFQAFVFWQYGCEGGCRRKNGYYLF